MRRRYNVYIPELYWNRKASSDSVHWDTQILAYSRIKALEIALPEIKMILADLPEDIKYISIFVGDVKKPTGYASRLHPIQIDREGQLR